jgi:hypothetical protein
MRLLSVLSLFLFELIVVRVCQGAMVVVVRVPVSTMLPLSERPASMVVRDVVMVVAVGSRLMTVLASLSLALRVLLSRFH